MAEIVEVEDNSSSNMQTLRIPPVLTVNKSAAYAMYQLTYIRVWNCLLKLFFNHYSTNPDSLLISVAQHVRFLIGRWSGYMVTLWFHVKIRLSQKFKPLGNDEFNNWTIILTCLLRLENILIYLITNLLQMLLLLVRKEVW